MDFSPFDILSCAGCFFPPKKRVNGAQNTLLRNNVPN